nr:malate synthase [Nephromyces sp. MMRI]
MDVLSKNLQFVNQDNNPYIIKAIKTLFTQNFIIFFEKLLNIFDENFQSIEEHRITRQWQIKNDTYKFSFNHNIIYEKNPNWKIDPLPHNLFNRQIDIGDVDPSNIEHLLKALNSGAQGVQVDFDDGFCPYWSNVIKGHHNIYLICRGLLKYKNLTYNLNNINTISYIMFRPRALNMIERNILVNGKRVSGALLDFALHIYHNGALLNKYDKGPYFYLSKIESYTETFFWNDVFDWTEKELKLSSGCIKACVLIECLTAVFQMDEILWSLKKHSAGLNCGLWDYSASFITRLGHNKKLLFPDRSKYVNMSQSFLSNYRKLLVSICHKRGAPATGGMFALVQDLSVMSREKLIEILLENKKIETLIGADGGLVYDLSLVEPLKELYKELFPNGKLNQIDEIWTLNYLNNKNEEDLLCIPQTGGATFDGLKLNIEVIILFIENWILKKGHFIYKGKVEDSATAEISRSQIWQQIRHKAVFEITNDNEKLFLPHNISLSFV